MSNSFPRPYLISFVPLHGLSQPVGWPRPLLGEGEKSHNWVLWASPLPWGQQQLERGPALWRNNGASQLRVKLGWAGWPDLAWVQKSDPCTWEVHFSWAKFWEIKREWRGNSRSIPGNSSLHETPESLSQRTSGPMLNRPHYIDKGEKASEGLEIALRSHSKSVPESRLPLIHQFHYQVMIYAIFYKHAQVMLLWQSISVWHIRLSIWPTRSLRWIGFEVWIPSGQGRSVEYLPGSTPSNQYLLWLSNCLSSKPTSITSHVHDLGWITFSLW